MSSRTGSMYNSFCPCFWRGYIWLKSSKSTVGQVTPRLTFGIELREVQPLVGLYQYIGSGRATYLTSVCRIPLRHMTDKLLSITFNPRHSLTHSFRTMSPSNRAITVVYDISLENVAHPRHVPIGYFSETK